MSKKNNIDYGVNFKCNLCDTLFRTESVYRAHLEDVHGIKDKKALQSKQNNNSVPEKRCVCGAIFLLVDFEGHLGVCEIAKGSN